MSLNRAFKIWLFIWPLFLFQVSGGKAAAELQKDTSNISIRAVDESKVNKFHDDPELNYDQEVEQSGLTLWQRIKLWFMIKFMQLFSNEGAAPYIRYILIIALIIFLVMNLIGARFQSLFYKPRAAVKKMDFKEVSENIREADLDELIQNEIANKNYRNAIRYYYLKFIKTLDDHDFIQWEQDKTNRDFFFELSSKNIKELFQKLTLIYEFSWYGNFAINNEGFSNYEKTFQKAFKTISNKRK